MLVVPPFAEEMNKCRRMVTEVSLGLVGHGVGTLVPDLYGTGDSGGDFSEADWSTWTDDVARTARWGAEAGMPVSGILAVRLGCALAASCVSHGGIGRVDRTVLWQPVFHGGRALAQFLRLRVAASLMEDTRETMTGMRQRLHEGEVLDVAGYGLTNRLAADLDAITVPEHLPESFGYTCWLEVVRQLDDALPPPAATLIDQTRGAGRRVRAQALRGEPFWASTEIVRNREIIEETISHLRGGQGGG